MASNLISPLGYAQQVATGKKTLGEVLLRFAGVSTPKSTPSQRGVNNLVYTERPTILKKVKDYIVSGDTEKATQLIETYNKNLFRVLVGIFVDRGMSAQDADEMVRSLIANAGTKLSSYFIKGITQKELETYQTKKGRTTLQNLILK